MTFVNENPQEEIRSGTSDNPSVPQKRRPGRPPGAVNKTRRDTQRVLDEAGPAVARRVIRTALGRAVLGPPDPETGKRKRVYPNTAEEQNAQRIILAKVAADKKSSEVSASVQSMTATEFYLRSGDGELERTARSILETRLNEMHDRLLPASITETDRNL